MKITLGALALLLSACATTTPYQPLERGVGYQDQRLESNRYRVSFAGSSATPRQTVENYVLYRAAELTLANGYDYFTLADASTDADQKSGGPSFGFGLGGFNFGSRVGFGVGVGTGGDTRSEYTGSAIVTLFRGKKPEGNAQAFDARELKANLEPSISRPRDAAGYPGAGVNLSRAPSLRSGTNSQP